MPIMDENTKPQDFYSKDTMSRVKNQEAIDSAVRKFRMAINASSESVQDRALVLAAKEELRAFA